MFGTAMLLLSISDQLDGVFNPAKVNHETLHVFMDTAANYHIRFLFAITSTVEGQVFPTALLVLTCLSNRIKYVIRLQ